MSRLMGLQPLQCIVFSRQVVDLSLHLLLSKNQPRHLFVQVLNFLLCHFINVRPVRSFTTLVLIVLFRLNDGHCIADDGNNKVKHNETVRHKARRMVGEGEC